MASTTTKKISYKSNKGLCLYGIDYQIGFTQSCSEPIKEPTQEDLELLEEIRKNEPRLLEEMMHDLDLSFLNYTLDQYYTNDYHFRFPPMAMLKSIIYFKAKGYHFLSQLHKELETSQTLAYNLGYDYQSKEIPTYNTLFHFMHYRLGPNGVKEIFEVVLRKFIRYCKRKNIPFGKDVGLDATPVPAKNRDKDTKWNMHYKQKCYLWHNMRDLETGIPIVYHLGHSREREGKYLHPMIHDYFNNIGELPKRVLADGGYANYQNFAYMSQIWNIEMLTPIGKKWKRNPNGNIESIRKRYYKHWEHPEYNPEAPNEEIISFLMSNDNYGRDLIGAMYRNRMMAWHNADPIRFKRIYNMRNRIEGMHGLEKRMYQINHIEASGLEKVTTHIGWHCVAMIIIRFFQLNKIH